MVNHGNSRTLPAMLSHQYYYSLLVLCRVQSSVVAIILLLHFLSSMTGKILKQQLSGKSHRG